MVGLKTDPDSSFSHDLLFIFSIVVSIILLVLAAVNLFRQFLVYKYFMKSEAIRMNVERFSKVRWCAMGCAIFQVTHVFGGRYRIETKNLLFYVSWGLWQPAMDIGLVLLSLELLDSYGGYLYHNGSDWVARTPNPTLKSDQYIVLHDSSVSHTTLIQQRRKKKCVRFSMFVVVIVNTIFEWAGDILAYFPSKRKWELFCFLALKVLNLGLLIYLFYLVANLYYSIIRASKLMNTLSHGSLVKQLSDGQCWLALMMGFLVFFAGEEIFRIVDSAMIFHGCTLMPQDLFYKSIINVPFFSLAELIFLAFTWVPCSYTNLETRQARTGRSTAAFSRDGTAAVDLGESSSGGGYSSYSRQISQSHSSRPQIIG